MGEGPFRDLVRHLERLTQVTPGRRQKCPNVLWRLPVQRAHRAVSKRRYAGLCPGDLSKSCWRRCRTQPTRNRVLRRSAAVPEKQHAAVTALYAVKGRREVLEPWASVPTAMFTSQQLGKRQRHGGRTWPRRSNCLTGPRKSGFWQITPGRLIPGPAGGLGSTRSKPSRPRRRFSDTR
jgi:hypothetical protein